jgi:hypothetical protein
MKQFLSILFLPFLVAVQSNASGIQKKYYVTPSGNDLSNGLSVASSWKTLDKVNRSEFHPGDQVLLEGGKTFTGNIFLDSLDSGDEKHPVSLSSFGKGKAIVMAHDDNGFFAINCSNIHLSNLVFRGTGVGNNKGNGIHFYSNSTSASIKHIVIENCESEGFYKYGILISCAEGENIKGFEDVRIIKCIAKKNGEAGIASNGGQTSFHHRNFYIAHCKAFGNKGIITKTDNHSGNGIVMSSVEDLLIEYCEAYENGEFNRCDGGGPVGIWVWLCKKAVIQFCESHHNHTGSTKDGGGFDIDGGSSECTIQYNYSHDNEGAGILLAEFGSILPFTNNTVRFNISENDGRKNSYGAISIWGVDSVYRVRNSFIYNNTIYLNAASRINGTPSAIKFDGPNLSGVFIANNIFAVNGGALLISSDYELSEEKVFFLSNDFYAYDKQQKFKWGNLLYSLIDWLEKASEQEKINDKAKALSVDPGLVIPGRRVILSNINLLQKELRGYHLRSTSLLRNKAIDLLSLRNINPGPYDFFRKPISHAKYISIGAALD